MKKEIKEKIVEAWGLSTGKNIIYPQRIFISTETNQRQIKMKKEIRTIKVWAMILPNYPINKGGLFIGINHQTPRIFRTKKLAKIDYPDLIVTPCEIKIKI